MNPRLGKLASDYAGDLALPLATIASGGSKILATFQLIGGVLVTKVLGPLGAIGYLLVGVISGMKNWASAAELVARAMQKAAAKEALTKQFAELTKSITTAKAKLQELINFSQGSPFRFESIVEGGKALARVSDGALLTRKNLQLVGDTAAASGQQFGTVAAGLSQLYDDLKNGRPIQESTKSLEDMGAISGSTAREIAQLQNDGAGLAVVFDQVTKSLEKNKGSMEAVQQSVEDLQQKQDELKAGILSPAGSIYNDAQKKGLEAQNAVLEKLAPTLAGIGTVAARVSTFFGYLQSGILAMIAKIPGLNKAATAAALAFSFLAVQVGLVSSAKFLGFVSDSIAALIRYTRAAGGAAAATAAFNASQAGNIGRGAGRIGALGTEVKYGVEGGLIGPRISAQMATGEALAGAGQIALGAGSKIASGALTLVRSAAGYLVQGLKVLTTGLGVASAALTAAGFAAYWVYDKYEKATKAIEDLGSATDKANLAFNEQKDKVQTAADAAVLYKKALDDVADSQKQYDKIRAQRQSHGFLDSPMDVINRQGEQEQAALTDLGFKQVNAKTIANLMNSGKLAINPEDNTKLLNIRLADQRAQQEAELNNPTLGAADKVQKLADIANESKSQMIATINAKDAADHATNKADRIDVLKSATGSEEAQLMAQLEGMDNTPENARMRQELQNRIALVQDKYGNVDQKREASISASSQLNQNMPRFLTENLATQEEGQARSLRLAAQVAGLSGLGSIARQQNAAGEGLEEDAMEARNKIQFKQENLDRGMTDADAQKDAEYRAGQARTQDLASKGLANLASISGPVVDSLQRIGGGSGIEQSDPLIAITQAQLDALTAIKDNTDPKNTSLKKKVY